MSTSNEQHKAVIQKGFDTVAPGYDHPALSFFPETAKRLVEHLQLKSTDNLLDVCTGTGVAALAAAEKLNRGKVTGIDLSTGMLQQAKNKAEKQNLNNTQFEQMDLDNLSFAENTFDVATCSFGLFFMEDMTKALTNISNKVQANGKVAITTFTGEAFSPMSDIFIKNYEETGRKMPSLSWKRLATEALIKEQFSAVNINKVEIHHEALGYQMTSAQMWWDVVWNAGWRSLLNMMPEQEQKQFEEKHRKEVAEVIGNQGVWFNTEVLIAIGEKG